jgi:hypothetical protein
VEVFQSSLSTILDSLVYIPYLWLCSFERRMLLPNLVIELSSVVGAGTLKHCTSLSCIGSTPDAWRGESVPFSTHHHQSYQEFRSGFVLSDDNLRIFYLF